ncbi:MAG: hypothetical protein IKQ27_05120 [Lachnospiraceae bacterium]|nr:hypothetical protein [Lachnospiraceae bacterium]MBR6156319.1 hypothetical protein [Lachnospiraceae bacterium]
MSDNMDMEMDGMDELEAMFGQENPETEQMEKVVLEQNLKGFASCFPEWDLHPPVD